MTASRTQLLPPSPALAPYVQAIAVRRQVFFVQLGGFDTHSGQSWQQWDLLRQLGDALGAFYNATVELGVSQMVTSFTQSEFGRSLQPSGSGTDHGWGNHHLILGGAVKGGQVYDPAALEQALGMAPR